MTGMRIVFGGPDCPPGRLRDLLEERIDCVPRGGEIRWVTYYFRDEKLALALVRARRRGVRVTVSLEARPRMRGANERVRRRLEGEDGLGSGFRSIAHSLHAHLHEKLYYFSAPRPTAFVGTFNPSGGGVGDAEAFREIGDQDRGHNYLVEITRPALVTALADHAGSLHRGSHGLLERFSEESNAPACSDDTTLYFFPRRSTDILTGLLRRVGRGGRVRIAASHIRDPLAVRILCYLAQTGADVRIIAHHTLRRVPAQVETALRTAGVVFERYAHPEELPMHNKFVTIEDGNARCAVFGSANLTLTSRHLNHEILVVSKEPAIVAALSARWDALAAEPSTGRTTAAPAGGDRTGVIGIESAFSTPWNDGADRRAKHWGRGARIFCEEP